jgi:hypothetical protein
LNCRFDGRPGNVSPPVFEQIFRNARFAQGGNALFEGKVQGNPKPVVSWTRKGAPLIGKIRTLYYIVLYNNNNNNNYNNNNNNLLLSNL